MFNRIEHAVSHDVAPDTGVAKRAAAAFGRFQMVLCDLPPPSLHETIPAFHNTVARYGQCMEAIERDVCNRAAGARTEIDAVRAREPLCHLLEDPKARGDLPVRSVHNDTKLNNVLFHAATGAALCVVDLDTVMPGLALHDFGDLVRTAGTKADEDETRLEMVELDRGLFRALAEGYISTAGIFLTAKETSLLHPAAPVITYEVALRFLADYLNGDVYFKTHRPGHNLDRCRAQLKLVASMERDDQAMQRIIRECVSG